MAGSAPRRAGHVVRDGQHSNHRADEQNVLRRARSTVRTQSGIAGKVQGMLGGAAIRHAKAEWPCEKTQNLFVAIKKASMCAPRSDNSLCRFTMTNDGCIVLRPDGIGCFPERDWVS